MEKNRLQPGVQKCDKYISYLLFVEIEEIFYKMYWKIKLIIGAKSEQKIAKLHNE